MDPPPYVDDGSRLPIVEAHVLGGRTDDTEWSNIVDVQHQLELLVVGLVEHGIEGVSCIVDNDVDLSESPTNDIARIRLFGHEKPSGKVGPTDSAKDL